MAKKTVSTNTTKRTSGPASGKTAGQVGRQIARPVVSKQPPLERALDAFTEALRDELKAAHDAIAALRADLDALRAQYEGHIHTYQRTTTGSGANVWFDLKKIRSYLEEEMTGYENYHNYGVYLRGGPTSGNQPPAFETSPPTGP